jgi:hypothetical protein
VFWFLALPGRGSRASPQLRVPAFFEGNFTLRNES